MQTKDVEIAELARTVAGLQSALADERSSPTGDGNDVDKHESCYGFDGRGTCSGKNIDVDDDLPNDCHCDDRDYDDERYGKRRLLTPPRLRLRRRFRLRHLPRDHDYDYGYYYSDGGCRCDYDGER